MFPENDIIDFASALERIGGDQEFLSELIQIYMEDFDTTYDSLVQAVSAQDFKAIQELGHSLKGSSANLSLLQLREKAYLVETAGGELNLDLAQRGTTELKREYERFKAFIAENR
jgi:HPt (histidine-containing phosphotransfer) domain-containing protein